MDKSVKTNGAAGMSKNAWSPQGGIDVSLTGHPHSLGDDSWMRLSLSRLETRRRNPAGRCVEYRGGAFCSTGI